MKVILRNENEKISREELKFAAMFMYQLLVSEYIHSQTTLIIESKKIRRTKMIMHGLTEVLSHEAHKRNPKKFKITLNTNLSKRNQLQTLAHELVHCKQYYKNELGFTYGEKGKEITLWKKTVVDHRNIHYFDLPWEIEANGREYGLWRRYRTFCLKHKMKF
jgi:hypothetical protein